MHNYTVSNNTVYDIHKFVEVYCPGTCANYCDADGFGNATAAEAIARRNANKTVLVPSLFKAMAQLRVRMRREFPDLRPNDIRDITTIPVSNEKVRDVAHAYEVGYSTRLRGGAPFLAQASRCLVSHRLTRRYYIFFSPYFFFYLSSFSPCRRLGPPRTRRDSED